MRTLTALCFFLVHTVIQAGEIQTGPHVLELDVLEISPEKTDLIGEIKMEGKSFKFHPTKKGIELSGKITEDGVLMWLSAEEKGFLRTFHFTGKISKNPKVAAEGKISLYQDHERIAGGTWQLRSQPAEPQEIPGEPLAGPADTPEGLETLKLTKAQAGMINAWMEKKEEVADPSELAKFVKSILRDDQQTEFRKIVGAGEEGQ